MREDARATRQLHYILCYGPFPDKDSASASLLQCYASTTNKLADA